MGQLFKTPPLPLLLNHSTVGKWATLWTRVSKSRDINIADAPTTILVEEMMVNPPPPVPPEPPEAPFVEPEHNQILPHQFLPTRGKGWNHYMSTTELLGPLDRTSPTMTASTTSVLLLTDWYVPLGVTFTSPSISISEVARMMVPCSFIPLSIVRTVPEEILTEEYSKSVPVMWINLQSGYHRFQSHDRKRAWIDWKIRWHLCVC